MDELLDEPVDELFDELLSMTKDSNNKKRKDVALGRISDDIW